MAEQTLAEHNVVATFGDEDGARRAIEELRRAGIPQEHLSFLARTAEAAAGRAETVADESEDKPAEVGAGVVAGGAAGAAGGGLAGLVAGAIAFGIPGVGAAIGSAIWAAAAGGAVAGATAGGVAGGIVRMWRERYEDAVREGSLVVGVHTGDEIEAAAAARVFTETGAQSVDRYDSEGRLSSSTPLDGRG